MLRDAMLFKKWGPALLLAVAVFMLSLGLTAQAGANEWSYAGDPGFVAKNNSELGAAKLSWQTPEYLRSWGLTAQKASTAYALGYYGQNVTVGMIDSGHNLSHQEFQGSRFSAPVFQGVYGSSGYRYRSSNRPSNPFTAGDSFVMTGDYYDGVITPDLVVPDYPGQGAGQYRYNGGHGTAMLGILGANRDGSLAENNMHGFAFASNIVLSNTGSTDSNAHGPYHDYNFMYQGYKVMVDAGAQVINSSWGSIQQTEPKRVDDPRFPGRDGVNLTVWYFRDLADEEWVHFYTKKAYGAGGFQSDPNNVGKSYLDAIYDAIKDTSVVHARSAANQDQENPNNMAFYPYFNPDAEKHWISVGGLLQVDAGGAPVRSSSDTGTGKYVVDYSYNEAGPYGKWWHMSMPSGDRSTADSSDPAVTTNDQYGTAGGTSGSAPHVTGAMALLLSRYPDMDAIQVRDVLFTTAQNKNPDGTPLGAGVFSPVNGEELNWTAPFGEPDERYGWGYPDIDKGMYGPGQFLSPFTYNMANTALDVWSNDIGEVGIKAREREDLAWLAGYQAQGIAWAGDYNLNNSGYGLYGLEDLVGVAQPGNAAPGDYGSVPKGTYPDWDAYFAATLDFISIEQADAEAWRKEWMDARAAYIQGKIDSGQYTASLTKQGPGTLVMTGNNTYGGGTTVESGALFGFTESFGAAPVEVNGGAFGLLSEYNDLFTMKGQLVSSERRLASVNVNNGATYLIVGGQNAKADSLAFAPGSKIDVISASGNDVYLDAYYNNAVIAGSVTANTLTGFENAELPRQDYAFLNVDISSRPGLGGGTTITGSISRNNDVSLADYAASGNAAGLAGLISSNDAMMGELVFARKDAVISTLDSLGSDLYLNADTASIVNAMHLSRMVKNQVRGIGGNCSAALGNTLNLWATTYADWGNADYGHSDMDTEFLGGLVGLEANVTANGTLGLFAGAGVSNFDGGRYGEIEATDVNFGLYGIYRAADVASLTYGVMHTIQERDSTRALFFGGATGYNSVSPKTNITQFMGEVAITKLNTDKYCFEPYAALNVIRLKTDDVSENIGAYTVRTDSNSQLLEAGTVGLRGSLPFSVKSMKWALKGDVSGTWFMGDNTPEAALSFAGVGAVPLKGGELDSLLNVGLGIEANITDNVSLGLSYAGSYNSDVQSNGLVANFRIAF